MSDEKIYGEFSEWMKNTWYGMPESEDLISVVASRHTPDEAAFLTGFPFRKTSLEDLAAMKEMDAAELEAKLDEMTLRGVLNKDRKDGKVRYSLADLFFSIFRSAFWGGKEDEYTQKVASAANSYFYSGAYTPWANVRAKGLRTLPIHQTVKDTKRIKPYEDVVKILDSFEYYTVSACPCRQRKKVDPDHQESKKPLEVCLHFDELGHYIVENGMGREITREETEAVLKKSADAGLVHGLSNWEEKPDTICNCDTEHCLWFEAYDKLEHDKSLDSSNYVVATTYETCKGCGLCVKRCPMDALALKDYPQADRKLNKKARVPELESDLCIGCGVCVHKCPTRSIVLELKEEIADPPKDARDWAMRYLSDVKDGTPRLRKKQNTN
ncbi:MAG: 4Fe-4S dicluster domain-containing protein [Proteobacteria bacterium]|nr:4Fe-4S dicluster domain-containing protein [Pseudomonadota bacterium]